MATTSIRLDSYAVAPPPPSDEGALGQAMLRAYSIERAVDYGCSLEDVLKLRRRVEAGHGWADIALQLAEDNEQRAALQTEAGHAVSASAFRLQAAACCRLAQAGLEHDSTRRLQACERQASDFGAALCDPLSAEYFEVARHEKRHGAWLFRAQGFEDGGAVVVVWGGADGWCEAFHTSVPYYLERGLSVCLLELPGQGLARLRGRSFLGHDFIGLVSGVLDALIARGAAEHRLGIVGHSAGGSLAVAAAAADERIRACCSNGGSVELKLGLLKFPRVMQRFGRMIGDDVSDSQVLDFLDRLDLEHAVKCMSASLLCLQGGQDPIVTDVEARRMVELRGSAAATLEYWPEGVHCVYNHAVERNCVITDWFATHLPTDRNSVPSSSRKLI